MQLSELQLKMLKRYWKYHSENYHTSDLILAYTGTWFLCFVCIGASYWLTKVDGFEWLGWCGVSFFVANLVFTIKSIRAFGKVWNVLDSIVAWDRVEALIRENEPVPPRREPKSQ